MSQGHCLEPRGDLLVGAAESVGVLAESGVARDVGVDATRMHVDGRDPGAAQFLTQRISEATDRELRRTVGTLIGHTAEAEDAGNRIHDGATVLLDEDGKECPGSVDYTAKVDVPQPVIILFSSNIAL